MLELGTAWFDLTAHDAELDEQELQRASDRMWQLYAASRTTSSTSTAFPAQMTGTSSAGVPPTTSSTCRNGCLDSERTCHRPGGGADLGGGSCKAKAKPKARPRSFDPERRMKADPRDPRTRPNQWPCFGKHRPGPPEANQWGQWIHCQQCNLRLLYTPRKGSPSNTTATVNAAMVSRMLGELHQMLGETMPTAKVCHRMMNKVTAEAVLQKSVRELLSQSQGYATSTTSPRTSAWGVVGDEEELVAAYENEACEDL